MFPEAKRVLSDRRTLLRGAGAIGLGALCAGLPGSGGLFASCASPRGRDDQATDEATSGADDLFAHLEDATAGSTPISGTERAARRARLGKILTAHGADALLVEPGATLTYLAGVAWGRSERLFALVVLADGSHFFVVPAFEESRARNQIDAPDGPGGALCTWNEAEYATAPLARALRERGVQRVLIEPQLRHVFAARLAQELPGGSVASGHAVIVELRAVKEEHELALLRRANEITQTAIVAVAETLRAGLTGAEIGARMDRAHRRLGLRSPWNLSLIGPAAALPHGDASARKLAPGDVVLIDTGGALHGYQSDITRTWVFGAAPELEIERVWHTVRDAQSAALAAIRAGVEARAVDACAREFVARQGFAAGYRDFTHRLGHGIGLEGHEDPYFDGGSDTILRAGMTLSVEPGLYFPGRFGVRIEDIIAVTPDGAEVFGTRQKGPGSPA
ncbi:MAG: aminopeptidase P family protein [Planctomycetes bacterium]|nr:aminopeptidase P family protein [Planctomycetota bacterium]